MTPTSLDFWTATEHGGPFTYRGRISLSGDGRSLILAPVGPEGAAELHSVLDATMPENSTPRCWLTYAWLSFCGHSSFVVAREVEGD